MESGLIRPLVAMTRATDLELAQQSLAEFLERLRFIQILSETVARFENPALSEDELRQVGEEAVNAYIMGGPDADPLFELVQDSVS